MCLLLPIENRKLIPARFKCYGFSLVEVTLALGIVAFALVTSLGLFSMGLGLFRKAIDSSVQGQITQRMMGSVRQTDFSRLASLDSTKTYFDDQGKEVTAPSDISAKKYIYEAALTVLNSTQLPSNVTGTSSTNLATVKVTITSISNPAFPFQFSSVVSSNGA